MSDERAFKAALDEYDAARVEYTPIRSPRGRVVHATSMHSPGKTCCGKKCSDGWVAVARPLQCKTCAAAVHFDVRPRKRRRRSKRRAR